jgi:glucokinase
MPKKTSPAKYTVIAFDLGGTKLASALFSSDGKPSARRSQPLNTREGAEVGAMIIAEIRRLKSVASKGSATIRAVGVSVPGIANARTGRVWAPNIPGWADYPLKQEIRSALAGASTKVIVENDRAASMLGELWQGAARGCRHAAFLAVGTGIGAGILVDGRILQGAQGIAGSIGWLALDRPFESEYTACGCFESHASGVGIAKVAAHKLQKNAKYRGPLRDLSTLTAHDVFRAHQQGDELAKAVIDEAIEFWGLACANLVSLFNPERIIFGGGVFGPATEFIDRIADEARRWAQPIAMQQVTFEAAKLGSDAALYGAAYRALSNSSRRGAEGAEKNPRRK